MHRRQRSPFPLSLLTLLLTLPIALIMGPTRASSQTPHDPLAAPGDAEAVALAYLHENAARWQLTDRDIEGLAPVDRYVSRHNDLTHIYFWQTYAGIEVKRAIFNASVTGGGEVLHAASRLLPDLATRVNTTTPTMTASAAVRAAAGALHLSITEPLQTIASFGGPSNEMRFSDGGISREPIPVRLVYQPLQNGDVRLAWDVEIYELHAQHYWSMRIDAVDGAVLEQVDYVIHDFWGPAGDAGDADHAIAATAPVQETASLWAAAGAPAQSPLSIVEDGSSYLVYAMPKEYPNDGPRTLETEPAHATASPYGWHDTDGAPGAEFTITRGNNVYAYTDIDYNNLPDAGSAPDGGPALSFSFPLDLAQQPATYADASVTNLFYWSNINHDVFYLYGFDEAAGNFQHNNYGNGGAGNDPLYAEALDGAEVNNAYFLVGSDGGSPRMEMHTWNLTAPHRDGALSSIIITHEYGHGISIRLTGGRSSADCLYNQEQMGEGWSDFFGLALTSNESDTATTPRGVGTYARGEATTGSGIRPARYSTDMTTNPVTYTDLPTLQAPHGVGYAWASMLWDVYWELVHEYGFNPDIYGDWTSGGNNLALQLVMDGLKLQPCSPGFVDGRDAILAADVALTGGVNQCFLWKAFARRGLGYSASQGSAQNRSDGVAAFDEHPDCGLIMVTPPTQHICSGTPAVYQVRAGDAYAPPVVLDGMGAPAGTTTTFDPHPLTVIPSTTTMTIDNTAGAGTGTYTITVTGDDATISAYKEIELVVTESTPGAFDQLSPAHGATGVPFKPHFSWEGAPLAVTYLLEVDDDPDFGSVDYSATVAGTSHHMEANLSPSTTYYWRVTAQNICGSTPSVAIASFTVQEPWNACNVAPQAFEEGIPDDWTVEDNSPSGHGLVWTTTADPACAINNLTNGSGEAACVDSDHAGQGAPIFDTFLVSPPFDLSMVTAATLDLKAYYRDLPSQSEFFAVAVWDGSTWSNLLRWEGSDRVADLSLDLSDYLGSTETKVRFRYAHGSWTWHAQVDDVGISCEIGGVDLSPDAETTGDPDADVTHTVQITNTGTTTDTYNLTVQGNAWNTTLSQTEVTLAASESTFVDVTVSIPAGASGGETDTATVWATSQANASLSASAALNTTATGYGVVLSEDAQASGAPGADIVYGVQISNTGTTTDTYHLTVEGNAWNTTLSQTEVTLAASESTSVDVTVSIPAGASGGETDTATVWATSQANASLSASAALNTTATGYGVALSEDAQASGAPGADIVYGVQISNTGTTTDTYELAVTGNAWEAALSEMGVTLAAGQSAVVNVTVGIPADATGGEVDTATVTATSQGSADASDSVTLQTTVEVAFPYRVYVPLVTKR